MNECEKYISVIFHCTKFKGGFSLILSKKRSTFFNRDNDLGPIYNPRVHIIGRFSNDDGDGKQGVKKAIGLLRKTTTSRFFAHFFTVLARLRRENA